MDSTVAAITTEDTHKESQTISPTHMPSGGGWRAAIFVIFVEMAERFTFYGLMGNLITYLTTVFHEPTATAAQDVNTWVGVSFVFPLVGAFIADSYLGRFNTILFSSIVYLLGMVLLTLSVSVVPLHSRKVVFYAALYIISIGEGGHKPCVQTFAADQFEEKSPEERKAKSSFFNWWYFGLVAGASSAILVAIYVQENVGWEVGFGMLAAALALSFVFFLLGIKKYKKQGPLGSPFTTVAQVLVAAAKKRRVEETRDGKGIFYGDETGSLCTEGQPKIKTLPRTKRFRFLDKAMVIDAIDASSRTRNPWRLCPLNQVEQVKLFVGLMPIWLSCLFFNVAQSQTNTFFTKQGSTMDRSIGPHFKIPAASLQSFVGLTMVIIIPVYDKAFVPLARRFTGNPSGITMLQRIGIGQFLSAATMAVAALVETKRVATASDHGLLNNPKAVLPVRVWWLLPQYILAGLSDVFAVVGLQQLFYDQMPEAMRSLGAALYISVIGVGSFISSGIISIVEALSKGKWLGRNLNRSHLDYFYWLLAGLSFLNLCVYVVIANKYVYKKVEDEDGIEEIEMSSNEHRSQHV